MTNKSGSILISSKMDDMCTACLCTGRKLYFIGETGHYHLYSQILNEIPVYDFADVCVRVCWECRAVLRRLGEFKALVKRSYVELLQQVHQNIPPHKTSLARPPRLQTQHVMTISYPDAEVKEECSVGDDPPLICMNLPPELDIPPAFEELPSAVEEDHTEEVKLECEAFDDEWQTASGTVEKKRKHKKITQTQTSSEEKDFSPSDESDFDPITAHMSDNDISTEDEYYDEQLVKIQMLRNERKCENIQKDKSENTVSRRKKLSNKIQCNKDEVVLAEIHTESPEEVSPERQKDNCEQRHDHKKMSKRRWVRRNSCFYCQELVTNYSRHLLRKHPNEKEVIKYKSINDADLKVRKQKRQEITDKLRNKGNFLHNAKVCSDKDGEKTKLLTKRNTQESSPSAFVTCKMCLGAFKRSTFFRHFKKCSAGANDFQTTGCRNIVLYNNSIAIIPNTESASVELRDEILPHLRTDEISLVVKNDPLILACGSRLLKKKKGRRNRKAICSKMRDLATLLIVLRKKDHSIETLTDVLDPEKYDTFIDGIKTMCGFDEDTGAIKVTSIPARMRPAILGCIDILYTQSIMSTESTAYNDAYKEKLDDFKHLVGINWEWEISSNAEKSRKRKNMT